MEQQLQFISLQLPKKLAAEARIEAAKRNLSRSELIRRAVVEFLKMGQQNG